MQAGRALIGQYGVLNGEVVPFRDFDLEASDFVGLFGLVFGLNPNIVVESFDQLSRPL